MRKKEQGFMFTPEGAFTFTRNSIQMPTEFLEAMAKTSPTLIRDFFVKLLPTATNQKDILHLHLGLSGHLPALWVWEMPYLPLHTTFRPERKDNQIIFSPVFLDEIAPPGIRVKARWYPPRGMKIFLTSTPQNYYTLFARLCDSPDFYALPVSNVGNNANLCLGGLVAQADDMQLLKRGKGGFLLHPFSLWKTFENSVWSPDWFGDWKISAAQTLFRFQADANPSTPLVGLKQATVEDIKRNFLLHPVNIPHLEAFRQLLQ